VSGSRRLLVVGPSWVGDMVMAQSLFRMLVNEGANVEIDVIAPRWALPLVARMPEVRRGIALDVGHGELALRERLRLGRELGAARYDQALILPRSLKAALVPFFAGISKRTGYRGEYRYGIVNDMRRLDAQVLNQTVKRYAALGLDTSDRRLSKLPNPRLKIDETNRAELVERWSLDTSGAIVALMPGAEYGPAKCWPLERFAELASRLSAARVAVWVLGSARERDIGAQIAERAGSDRVVNLCGRTELTDAVDLLSIAHVAVTNDSGLMHVAAAVGSHVIAIYGSSTPDCTPPLTETRTIFYERLECSPCFERSCPLGHLRCLRAIDVSSVALAVGKILGRRSDGPRLSSDRCSGDGRHG
jgi:heptosyltransferase-2